MTPERKEVINGHKIEEYIWSRKLVVYIDNQAFEGTFWEAIDKVKQDNQPTHSSQEGKGI